MRTKLICALLTLCLFCSGCTVMDLDTQNLMSPPKATGDKADIQKVIEENAGSYTLKYPQKGAYRSAVIMHDINGDGNDEAIAFYKTNISEGVSDITVIFIDQIAGVWQKIAAFQNSATEVERICFADINGDGTDAVLIGWSNYSTANQATVFRYENGKISPFDLEYTYTDLVLNDFDKDGSEELFMSSVNTADKPAAARLLKYSSASDSLVNVGEVEMNPDVTQYAAFQTGELENGYRGVYIDGVKSGNQMTTELVYWDPENQRLQAPFYTSAAVNKFTIDRPTDVTCMDINGDGILEIPNAKPFNGNAWAGNAVTPAVGEWVAAEVSSPVYITQWQQYFPKEQELVTVQNMYVNNDDGYYFLIPSGWLDSMTGILEPGKNQFTLSEWVVNSEGVGAAGAAVLKIRVFTKASWDAQVTEAREFTSVLETGEKVYAVSIPESGSEKVISYNDVAQRLGLINSGDIVN